MIVDFRLASRSLMQRKSWVEIKEIVDDEKVAVENVGVHVLHLLLGFSALEGGPAQKVEELKGRKIDHRMGRFQKLPGNAVGEKGLAHARITVEKEILEIRVEIPDEIHGFRHKFFHCDKGRKAGGGAHRRIGIVTE